MADEAAATEVTQSNAEVTTTEAEALGEPGKKALEAERRNARQAAKERDALAAQLKEFEDRDKTETQRLGEAADAFQKRAVEAENRAMRLEIAAEKGLTPAQAKRLVGESREELEADADDLLENFKPSTTDATETVTTALDLGTRGTTSSASGDPAADFAAFMKRL